MADISKYKYFFFFFLSFLIIFNHSLHFIASNIDFRMDFFFVFHRPFRIFERVFFPFSSSFFLSLFIFLRLSSKESEIFEKCIVRPSTSVITGKKNYFSIFSRHLENVAHLPLHKFYAH